MAEEALPPNVIRQTVVVVDSSGGPLQLSVGDEFEAVALRVKQAAHGAPGASHSVSFAQPFGGGRVCVPDARKIIAIFEQLVQLTKDPRQAGIFKTGSGIELPRPA